MAILKLLNEFGRESTVLTIEVSRKCISHCTYCFSELNARVQWGNKKRDFAEKSTFETIMSRALGPSYDPSDFVQYSIRNRYPICMCNTVEPFQDAVQANAILAACDRWGSPLWFQTKAYNLDAVWDTLKNFHNNSSVLISFPSPDPHVIKRFEPGTTTPDERRRAIARLADAGFRVTLGLSPYCEEWVDDPVPFVEEMLGLGCTSVFFDRLHLSPKQGRAATDRKMVELAGTTYDWPDKCLKHYIDIYNCCLSNDVPIFANSFAPTMHGYVNTCETVADPAGYTRGQPWPYHDGMLHSLLHECFFGDPNYDISNRDFDDSMLVTWADALALMELGGAVTQPFSWASMRDLMAIKYLPADWLEHFKSSKQSPISEYYRALWNDPSPTQFAWGHPWSKLACKRDGSPHVDEGGNLIMLFDPDWPGKAAERRHDDDLSHYRRFRPS